MIVDIRHGDCREILKSLPDNCIDSVVTDPPYELFFMGSKWDGTGVAFEADVWDQVLRVIKPGGHVIAFGADRRIHRLMCAIEDAGFELRTMGFYVSASCLSDDTEVLVDGEWVSWLKAKTGAFTLCYDVGRDEFSWQPIGAVHVFWNRDPLCRLVSDRTDQLVTGNHRCIVERDGAFVFVEAEEAARQQEARVPVLEDVRGLLSDLPCPQQKRDTTPDVLDQVLEPAQATERTRGPSSPLGKSESYREEMSPVWGTGCHSGVTGHETAGQESLLCQQPDRELGAVRVEWGTQTVRGEGRTVADLVRFERVSHEGIVWCLTVPTGAFVVRRNGKVFVTGNSFPKSLDISKEIDRISGREVAAFKEALRDVVEGSGKTRKQISEECGFSMRHDTPYDDDPKGWGITVPKADQWETIKHVLGIEDERMDLLWKSLEGKLGDVLYVEKRNNAPHGLVEAGRDTTKTERTVRASATSEAARWEGWGTALKNQEPWVLARKPIEGTVVENILRHGVGGLYIDGCRVPVDMEDEIFAKNPHTCGGFGHAGSVVYGDGSGSEYDPTKGRWPSAIVCSDEDMDGPVEGIRVIAERVGGNDIGGVLGDYTKFFRIGDQDDQAIVTALPEDLLMRLLQTGVICPKASTGEREMGLDGFKTTWVDPSRKEGSAGRDNPRAGAGRKSKRKNTHPTIKPIGLMRHLVRLVTPPGGKVLDPFCGVASTGVAAVWEDKSFLGIELTDTEEKPYVRIARARVDYAKKLYRTPEIHYRTARPTAGDERQTKLDI